MLKATHEGPGQLAGVEAVRMYVVDGAPPRRFIAAADVRRVFLHGIKSDLFDDIFLDIRCQRIKSKNGVVSVMQMEQFMWLLTEVLTLGMTDQISESEQPLFSRCVEINSRLAMIGMLSANDAKEPPGCQ